MVVRFIYEFNTPDFILPTNLTTIEESAFEGDTMSVVYIPDNCNSIADFAFKDCNNLIQIRIPENCLISGNAFEGCDKVFIFGTAGSPAEAFCQTHDNCVFMEESQG